MTWVAAGVGAVIAGAGVALLGALNSEDPPKTFTSFTAVVLAGLALVAVAVLSNQ